MRIRSRNASEKAKENKHNIEIRLNIFFLLLFVLKKKTYRLPRLHRRLHEPPARLDAGVHRREARRRPRGGPDPVQQRFVRPRSTRRRRWRSKLRKIFFCLSFSLVLSSFLSTCVCLPFFRNFHLGNSFWFCLCFFKFEFRKKKRKGSSAEQKQKAASFLISPPLPPTTTTKTRLASSAAPPSSARAPSPRPSPQAAGPIPSCSAGRASS